MRVAVVGGGVTGLTIAGELLRRDHEVVVFEKGQPGGLAWGFEYPGRGGVFLEIFYHHIFTSDTEFIELINEHGLGDDLQWLPSRSGLIARGKPWPFAGAMDLLRFEPLGSLWQRVLMGWNLRYFTRTENWHRLDRIRCREFFAGRHNLAGYRNLWEPLLKQKFSDAFDDIPASFLWGRIYPRARSRNKKQESLGYLKGGFQRLFIRMVEAIQQRGGQVHAATNVTRIESGRRPQVTCGNDTRTFDRVIWTAGPRRLIEVLHDPPAEIVGKSRAIEYLAATQLILIMKRRQTDYYWLNNIDPGLSFGGLIEHTNLVSPENYGGEHVLYVVNYHRPGDPRFAGKTAADLLDHHCASLKCVARDFHRDDVLRMHCIRDGYSSPLYDLGFADRRPPYQGWVPGVDLCGMSQVYPEDRNMNHCVRNAWRYVEECFAQDGRDRAQDTIEQRSRAA